MLEDFISGKKSLFTTGVHTELRAQENKQRRVALVQGNLTANARLEKAGVCARVYKNGVYGFSSMAECTSDAAETVLKAATENALFMDGHIQKGKNMFPAIAGGSTPLYKAVCDTEQKRYIEFVKEIDAYISEKYPKLSSRSVILSADSMEKIICTSDGYDGHVALPRTYIYLFLNSESTAGVPLELFDPVGGYGNFDDVFKTP